MYRQHFNLYVFFIYNYLLFILLGLCLQSCNNYAESPYPTIEFQQEASMPDNGRSSAVGFAILDKGYVALGKRTSNSNYLNDCWEFSPDSNKWTKKSDFPGVARVKAVAAVVNGKAYVGLGFAEVAVYQNTGYLNDFWMFDPVTNSWTRKKDYPSKSTDACVSFVYKNNIYVGSGYDGHDAKADFWKYDPESDSWTQLADFKGESRFGSVVCTNGKKVFFGGGFRSSCENDWWEFFPESDSWSQVKGMSDNGRVNGVALSVNDRFFVATGRFFAGNLTGGQVKSDILEYDAIRNVWYKRGNIPNGNRENAISFIINGTAYIGFGENDQTVLNDLWSFKP